jgi:hypothetical protein
MRLFGLLVITAICTFTACSLYDEGSSSITGNPLPDAGNHHDCGGGGLPDAAFLPDGGWIDDAPNLPDAGTYDPDGGSYLPDAYIDPIDAGHGHH